MFTLISYFLFLVLQAFSEPAPRAGSSKSKSTRLSTRKGSALQEQSGDVETIDIESDAPVEQPQQITLTKTQLTKLQRELEVVEGNMSVLSEMLAELTPGKEIPADLELMREIYVTCRTMQVRLVELLERIASDQTTAHLLKINDDLNNLFLR